MSHFGDCKQHLFPAELRLEAGTGLGLSGQALTFAERANLKREEPTVGPPEWLI